MALTTEEQKILQFGIDNGKTEDEVLRALDGFRAQQEPTFERPSVSAVGEARIDVLETVARVGGEFGQAGENILDVLEDTSLSFGERLRGIGSESFKRVSRGFAEAALGVGKVALPQQAEEAVAGGVEAVGRRIGEIGFVQDIVRKYQTLSPDVKREVDNALGFTEGLADIITVGGAGKVGRVVANTVVDAASSGIKLTGKLTDKVTPKSVVIFERSLGDIGRDQALQIRKETYDTAFVGDKTAINNALEKQSRGASFGDTKVTPDDLLTNLAQEGYAPTVKGKLGKFDKVFEDITEKQRVQTNKIDGVLKLVREKTTVSSLRDAAKKELGESAQTGPSFNKSIQEVDKLFDSYVQRFGENLSASEVNQVRKDMNRLTKAFSNEEIFIQDTADAIADASRNRLDELVPEGDVRIANEEWGRLQELRKTAKVFHNKPISVGILGNSLGRYIGATAIGGAGLASGSGSLVIAGLAAGIGGDAFANWLRKARFNDEITQTILKEITNDPKAVLELTEAATGDNKAYLEGIFQSIISGVGVQQEKLLPDEVPTEEAEGPTALLSQASVASPAFANIQSEMDQFIESAQNKGFEVNENGEIVNPTPEIINEFNARFFTTGGEPKISVTDVLKEIPKETVKTLGGIIKNILKAPIRAGASLIDVPRVFLGKAPLSEFDVPLLGEAASAQRQVLERQEAGETQLGAILGTGGEAILDVVITQKLITQGIPAVKKGIQKGIESVFGRGGIPKPPNATEAAQSFVKNARLQLTAKKTVSAQDKAIADKLLKQFDTNNVTSFTDIRKEATRVLGKDGVNNPAVQSWLKQVENFPKLFNESFVKEGVAVKAKATDQIDDLARQNQQVFSQLKTEKLLQQGRQAVAAQKLDVGDIQNVKTLSKLTQNQFQKNAIAQLNANGKSGLATKLQNTDFSDVTSFDDAVARVIGSLGKKGFADPDIQNHLGFLRSILRDLKFGGIPQSITKELVLAPLAQ